MLKQLASILNNLLTSGWADKAQPSLFTRVVFLNLSLSIAIGVIAYYFFRDLGQASSQAYVEAAVGLVFVTCLGLLRLFKAINLVIFLILSATLLNYLLMIFTGGTGNTGLYWFALFPVSAFFLQGRKGGLIWSVVFLVLAWTLVHLGRSELIDIAFDYSTASQALVVVGVIVVFMYFYDTIGENYQAMLRKQGEDMLATNKRLEKEVQDRTSAEQTLAESIAQIEEQNKNLEASKEAMLNVIEDEKALEEQLKLEKASVEKKVEQRTIELRKEKDELTEANRIIQESISEIAQEKSRLDASINSLSLGFIMTDTNNLVVAINASAQKVFGTKKDLISFSEVNLQVTKELKLSDFVDKAKKTKIPQEVKEVSYKDKILRLFVSPIITLAKTEEYIGSVVILEDITEAKIVERSKDEFLSIASHELRTPLAAIRSYASLLAKYYPEKIRDEKYPEMVNDIHDSTVRLIQLVNDFLDTSKLEQGKVEFKKEKFDVSETINQVISDMKVLATNNKIYLKFNSKVAAKALADSERTKQILVNLIGNALKFTKSGGIKIDLYKEAEFVKVTISDTGKGIAAKNQKLLFRKFQQAEESILTRDYNQATGLGLYISKLLVEGMGGKIWLDSSVPSKGSVFAFTLPASR